MLLCKFVYNQDLTILMKSFVLSEKLFNSLYGSNISILGYYPVYLSVSSEYERLEVFSISFTFQLKFAPKVCTVL